jgi:RNA polymerase sigma factor (sigma-70 family)
MREAALDRLADWFQKWRTPLRRYLSARRAVLPADIEDVAQEVFLRMLRYDRSEFVEHPQAYLFKIAANVAAEWSIRSNRSQPHESGWLADIVAESSPESEIDGEIADEELSRALQRLQPRAREVIRLHYADGLTHEAIAERLKVTRRMVKRDLIQAYATLRVSLSRDAFEACCEHRKQADE